VISRKIQIAKDSEVLNRRMNEQNALNERAIKAKLNGELAENDFQTIKRSITEEISKIEAAIQSLDAETSTMEALVANQHPSSEFCAGVEERQYEAEAGTAVGSVP